MVLLTVIMVTVHDTVMSSTHRSEAPCFASMCSLRLLNQYTNTMVDLFESAPQPQTVGTLGANGSAVLSRSVSLVNIMSSGSLNVCFISVYNH